MTDELKAEIAKARATYDNGRGALSDLCHGERPLMSIPARPKHDADLLISDSLELVPRLIAALELAIDKMEAEVRIRFLSEPHADDCVAENNAAILRALRGEA